MHALLEKQRKTGKPSTLDDIVENSGPIDKCQDGGTETPTHSRLLTKKQLSDMAWGVRELSKTLGGIRLKLRVKAVFLLTKAHDETLIGYTREVAAWLLSKEREVQYIVYVCTTTLKRRVYVLISYRYVEKTLQTNSKFDAQGLVAEDPSYEDRLKYWTNELCATRPHTFDIVVTVWPLSRRRLQN